MKILPFGKPIIGDEERKAVLRVLHGSQLVHGPEASNFEGQFRKFLGGGYAQSVASCTAGLHLAYIYFGIGSGDEVIVPAQTHVATAHSVEYTGAKPVFVDVEIETGNIDVDRIETLITPNTKAISVVHYLGLPVEMDKITNLAKKYNLYIVEDAALALGAYYKNTHVGLIGDIASFSFYPVKHITTAEGGMLVTRHANIASKVARLKSFGYDKMVGERTIPGLYDVDILGRNYRMNEIEAAIGIEQLKRLGNFLRRRELNSIMLRSEIQDIDEIYCLDSGNENCVHAHYCVGIVLNDSIATKRYEFISELKKLGIGTSVYYPGPVPHLQYYKNKYGFKDIDYPNASKISNCSVALPVGPHLEEADMKYIGTAIRKIISDLK